MENQDIKKQSLVIFIHGEPPRTTAQEKKLHIVNGKPVYYMPKGLKAAKKHLITGLRPYKPPQPLQGAIKLRAEWVFGANGKDHKNYNWKTTRPDTDNLQKLLKDCMTECGFWADDAQVAYEIVQKYWAVTPGIWIFLEELDGNSEGGE